MNIEVVLPRVLEYPYIEKKVLKGNFEKIKKNAVHFVSKRINHTLFGKKYELSFSTGVEQIVLYVDKEIYDYFEPGWNGEIRYLQKKLYGICL